MRGGRDILLKYQKKLVFQDLTPTIADEASFRSSISRSYFGVFCLARNQKGYNKVLDNIHDMIKKKYLNSSLPKEKEIGRVLGVLRKERNDADYDESIEITGKKAEMQ